jgi:cell division protein FtsW
VPLLARPLASYYLILATAGLLLMLGLIMVLSASSVRSYEQLGSSYAVFARQAMWVSFGLPVLAITSRLGPRRLRVLAYPSLIVSLILLMAVLVPGVGTSVNGATRWIGVGPYTLQPSELAKLALVVWGADLFVRKQKLLVDWKHLLVPLVPVATLICLLVMLQPDMGTTIVLLAVLLGLLWVVGAPLRLFGAVSGGILLVGTFFAIREPYRFERLASYTDPFKDAHDTGFQAVQGLYALASGGWWGEGLGASREKWPGLLPNAHTDFILAIIGEELGLLGTLVVVLLFAVLGYAGIRVAQRSTDLFARLAAGAATAWILGQAIVNMGAVVGLLPITGIPLPLVSFGGSSLVPTMAAIGMLLAFARAEPAAAEVIAARRRNRRAGGLFWRARRVMRAGRSDAAPAAGPEAAADTGGTARPTGPAVPQTGASTGPRRVPGPARGSPRATDGRGGRGRRSGP